MKARAARAYIGAASAPISIAARTVPESETRGGVLLPGAGIEGVSPELLGTADEAGSSAADAFESSENQRISEGAPFASLERQPHERRRPRADNGSSRRIRRRGCLSR